MAASHPTAWDEYGCFTVVNREDPGPSCPSPLQTLDDMDTTFQFLPNDLDPQTKQENFESEIAASDPPTEPPTELPPPLTANPTKLLQQLIQGLALLGHAAPTPPATIAPPANVTRIWAPDVFDGSNPDNLQPFLLQCQLTFNMYPQQYAADSAKVCFATSYLKKSALEWFENRIMETNPQLALVWRSNWGFYVKELRTHFGPANPIGDAEIELCQLTMASESWVLEYLVRFNTLASRVTWGNSALRFQFYNGLPDRLKDQITILGKPKSLRELVDVTTRHDALYWE